MQTPRPLLLKANNASKGLPASLHAPRSLSTADSRFGWASFSSTRGRFPPGVPLGPPTCPSGG